MEFCTEVSIVNKSFLFHNFGLFHWKVDLSNWIPFRAVKCSISWVFWGPNTDFFTIHTHFVTCFQIKIPQCHLIIWDKLYTGFMQSKDFCHVNIAIFLPRIHFRPIFPMIFAICNFQFAGQQFCFGREIRKFLEAKIGEKL